MNRLTANQLCDLARTKPPRSAARHDYLVRAQKERLKELKKAIRDDRKASRK